MILLDYWEELGKNHKLVESSERDPWPRSTCWTRYLSGCSCGRKYPVIWATDAETRNSAHLKNWRQTHSHAEHLKHLVQELLETKGDIWVGRGDAPSSGEVK